MEEKNGSKNGKINGAQEREKEEGIKKFARICPNCKSFNIKTDFPISPAYGIPEYVCLDCGFKAKIFPEISLNEKEK